ncbi:TonB system transport protein ExbD [Aggregatibacter actinomycetemcomitans]|uniref:TonB system transport protein ExbD n=1 Tax=Aggregatibacter actinomycetemcomitans TaxID=714 RepID=UPI00197C39D9|nr:TonB system transport protein ExbD [Aggregatibacter actinomycetemcomitans]MBN6068392.1 TonB system transport protein ExbD [Aggregatibacter actinomycetemcomitans]MBN6085090.1 TonB system transport protein ExbD [Aggregatibacter actinomycetemcomitans]
MKKFDEINIIPFIDIMLVLLAIVLITASFISQGKIQVNVPKASSSVAFKSNELAKLLTVTAKGELYFNDKPTNLESLESEIAGWDKKQKVTLKIDSEASFQDFVSVTDLLAKNEIKDVAIVATKDNGADKPRSADEQSTKPAEQPVSN